MAQCSGNNIISSCCPICHEQFPHQAGSAILTGFYQLVCPNSIYRSGFYRCTSCTYCTSFRSQSKRLMQRHQLKHAPNKHDIERHTETFGTKDDTSDLRIDDSSNNTTIFHATDGAFEVGLKTPYSTDEAQDVSHSKSSLINTSPSMSASKYEVDLLEIPTSSPKDPPS